MTYLFLRLSSKYENSRAEHVPVPNSERAASEPPTAWTGLTDLRRSLVKRGMFMEANGLFRVEFNRIPLKNRAPAAEEFLASLSELPACRGKDLVDAVVRLQWATTYVQLFDLKRAEEELDNSEAAIGRWCSEVKIVSKSEVPHCTSLRFERLKLIDDHKTKLQAAEHFTTDMERMGSGKAGSAISAASESALALYQSTGSIEYLEKFFALHEKLRHFDETVSEDLSDLIWNRNTLLSIASTTGIDVLKSLEWIEGFLNTYPHFKCPNELEQLHRRQAILLGSLQRPEEAKQATEVADKYSSEGSASALGNWLHLSGSNIIAPRSGANGSHEYDSEDDEVVSFWVPWANIVGDQEKRRERVVELLVDWALEDVVAERWAMEDVQRILGVQDLQLERLCGAEEATDKDEVKSQCRAAVDLHLFPPYMGSETPQENRCALISNWLSKPPKGQRNQRLFCLLILRDTRQFHFGHIKEWELQIKDINFLLELYPTLPGQMREICRVKKGVWLAELSLMFAARLQDISTLDDPTVYKMLLQAEEHCKQSIEELGKTSQRKQIAIQHQTMASICLLKIRRLERAWNKADADAQQSVPQLQQQQKEKEVTASIAAQGDAEEFRRLGLASAIEADKIHTAIELEASWSGGVRGVDERQRVARYHSSFWNVHLAISLHLTATVKITDGAVQRMWSWVQRYKARSLSRTIGIGNTDPAGLKDQIMASAESRSKYEEMVRLEKEIAGAKYGTKFDLRRRLDKHLSSMKDDDLLRRLINLREGTPLGLSDIAAIEAEVGSPIVLVDWFYMTPSYRGDKGNLLLFTARANSQPTMDILPTTMEAVENWRIQYLQSRRLTRDIARPEFDSELGGLIAPLAKHTKPEDILVLCPSTTLHKLPLHALFLHGSSNEGVQVLIERNRVVYSHSHSLLRSCASATEQARVSPAPMRPQFIAGISKAHAEYKRSGQGGDYTKGHACITDLARWFNAPAMLDADASKQDFLRKAAKSRLLHVHTHCEWDSKDPLDHNVRFPELDPGLVAAAPQDYKLTAREVFNMRLLPGTHINLVACQGGLTEVKPGDEVMGLVPALLYSGASSTISTLWSIADGDGSAFSKFFFQAFLEQCEKLHDEVDPNEAICFVDVAEALQTAVVKMCKAPDQPLYGWASFVMHGYWRLPLSRSDIEWLATNVYDNVPFEDED